MKKIFIFLSILLGLNTIIYALPIDSIIDNTQNVLLIQDDDTIVQKDSYYLYDTAFVEKRSFDQDKLTKYRTDSRYEYELREIKEDDEQFSWWDKLKYRIARWIIEFLSSFYSTFTTEDGSLSIIFYLAAIVLVSLIAFFLLRTIQGKILRKGKGKKSELEYETFTEDIHEMDFDTLLEEAIKSQLYRRAVRILFLKSLKELTDKQFIQWEENKTNRDYVYEIKSQKLRDNFENISNVFEYVWYGEVELNTENFTQVQQEFRTFSKQIQQKK